MRKGNNRPRALSFRITPQAHNQELEKVTNRDHRGIGYISHVKICSKFIFAPGMYASTLRLRLNNAHHENIVSADSSGWTCYFTAIKMAEEVVVAAAVSDPTPVELPTVEIKLFKRWTTDDVNVTDISLTVSVRKRRTCCGPTVQ